MEEVSNLHDPLTGLPSRLLFRSHLDRCVARAQRHEEYGFALLFLDVDRFKIINDRLGHAVGDKLLVEVARRLSTCVRACDIVGRHSGDEFTILLDEITDLTDATRVATQILDVVKAPLKVGADELRRTISIGIALSGHDQDADQLIHHADMAMYRAKTRGRGRLAVFDEGMYAETMARISLEVEVRDALSREEFSVMYQPIVDIDSGAIRGFEALLRWDHPERGSLNASEFLVAANAAGIMNLAGDWVLREACAQAASWQREFPRDLPLTISVNLSAKELTAADFVFRVAEIIGDVGLYHDTLRLDVNEVTMNADAERSFSMLAELNALGVRTHLDNFGRGASSLMNVQRYPVHALKIDRDLIARMESEPAQRELVKAIMCVADVMKIELIAEGVETAEQMNSVRASGACRLVQGYHIARPMSAVDATALLALAEPL